MKKLMRELKLDAIYGLDAETYWANDYTLSDKKRGTTEYVTDPRFELQLMSVRKDSWASPRVMEKRAFESFARTVDWSRAGMLAHHAQFDGLIASHHCGIKPAFYFDTLSMARPLMPVAVGGSLKKVCAAFGRQSKLRQGALTETKGKRWAGFTKAEKGALKDYAGDDIDDCWFLLEKMLPFYSVDELRLIDTTVRMYAQPSLLLDKDAILGVLANDIKNKEDMLTALKLKKTHLTSKDKFAELLREAGVEPPMKISVKQSEKAGQDVLVLAMSKQDQEFKDLLAHPIKKVRQLMEARFAVSSNTMETRCTLLASRAHLGPQPVYLNYYGAKTGRWSGGDNANWQNLSSKRKEGGAELRAAVHAPPGHMLIIADLAQIEARINFWFSGQENIVDVFRAYDAGEGPDVYRYTAANDIYNKHIDLVTDAERFLGKSCVLALGFQAGWKRFAAMLRVGALGPPVDISDDDAKRIHKAWRDANPFVVANWKATNQKVNSAFMGKQRLEDGVVSYEGKGSNGWMHLPGGMAIRYDDLSLDGEGKLTYVSKVRHNRFKPPTIETTRLYGGILVENRTQALARRVIGEHMNNIRAELKDRVRIAMSTHDEIVGVVPTRSANKALGVFKEIMSAPPDWAKSLPLAVDAHISARYDK